MAHRRGVNEMDAFIEGSRKIADGYISFYWGKTIEEYGSAAHDLTAMLITGWLKHFRTKTPAILDMYRKPD